MPLASKPFTTLLFMRDYPPFLSSLLLFLFVDMVYYGFSYNSLLFAVCVIYSSVAGYNYREELQTVAKTMRKTCRETFVGERFAPFNGGVRSDTGNVTDAETEEDETDKED